MAKGRVGIIGGGNSALDAARVAIRQPDVTSVTIFYRRTREEMPAFEEEIEAALQEGVKLETLVSPTGILSDGGIFPASNASGTSWAKLTRAGGAVRWQYPGHSIRSPWTL